MNYIDTEMQKLIKEINEVTETELKNEIKEKYLKIPKETRKSIEDFFSKFNYWGSLSEQNEDFTEIENKAKVLKENNEQFQTFFEDLQYYRSKKVLYAILKNWKDYDFNTLSSVMEKTFTHYFDLDIIPECKEEVFVDLGAYTGDTIEELLKNYKTSDFKRIYAYEMSENSIIALKEKTKYLSQITVRHCGVADVITKGSINENEESASANILQVGEGNLSITTLDEDIKEKITMIKMDIEGCEQKALKGAEKHIKEETPKMMISVYHGFNDLIEIYSYLKELNPKYKFFLRYYGGPIFPTEIVLYAI